MKFSPIIFRRGRALYFKLSFTYSTSFKTNDLKEEYSYKKLKKKKKKCIESDFIVFYNYEHNLINNPMCSKAWKTTNVAIIIVRINYTNFL